MTKWVTKKLGEIGNVAMCKRIFSYETTPEGEVPFYKIGTFGKKADAYISKTKYEEYKNKFSYPKKGDILLSASGTIGRTVVYDGVPAYFQDSNIIWLSHDEKVVLNEFLFYLYKDTTWNLEGSTIARLYNDNFYKIEIPIPIQDDGTPDLAEQRRIAAILGSADKVIATSEALIEKYKHIKQGLLTDLLQPKEGWKKVKLGECCDTDLGKTLDGGRNTGQYMPYLCALNVLWGKIDLSTIKQMRIEESEKERYLIKRGDLLVCEGGEIGRCAIWDSDEEIYYQNALHRVRFKEEYDATFFMYLLGHYNDLNLIEKYGKGLTIMHLNQTSFRNIPVLVPDLTEQRRIASILSSIDAKILAEEKVVEKYKGVKKGMMNEQFTMNNLQ